MCEFNDIYQRPHKAIGLPVYHSNWINHYTVMLMGHGCGVRMSTVTIPTTHSARVHMMHVIVVDALHGMAYSVPVPLSLHFLVFCLLHGSKIFNRAVALLKGVLVSTFLLD